MSTKFFHVLKCPAPTHNNIRFSERVKNSDRPTYGDERLAHERFMARKISYDDYQDVINFIPIFYESRERKIAKVRRHLKRVRGVVPTDRQVSYFLQIFED